MIYTSNIIVLIVRNTVTATKMIYTSNIIVLIQSPLPKRFILKFFLEAVVCSQKSLPLAYNLINQGNKKKINYEEFLLNLSRGTHDCIQHPLLYTAAGDCGRGKNTPLKSSTLISHNSATHSTVQ